MVKKLSKEDILAIRRLERINRTKPFITYGKGGKVIRHSSLSKATAFAKGQSLIGRRGFVDKDEGKFTRSVKIFEPRLKRRGKK